MKKNMGSLDKTIRILIALVIVGLFFTKIISGIVAIILLSLAGIFILTSFMGTCPIWMMLGVSTIKKNFSNTNKQ